MNAASAAVWREVERNHQYFFHLVDASDLSLLIHCWGDVRHICRKFKPAPRTIPFVKGPLLQFLGSRSSSLAAPFSKMDKASSIIPTALSISFEEMISGGIIRITGSK